MLHVKLTEANQSCEKIRESERKREKTLQDDTGKERDGRAGANSKS